MMNVPLTLKTMLERAEKYFPKKMIISRTESGITRLNYKEFGERTRRLASILERLGVSQGDRVGTLAWNHHRHLESYFAIPCMGAVLHTINIRLSLEQIVYIINHAEDKVLLIDPDILPLIDRVRDQLKTVEHFIVMTDHADLPTCSITPLYSYEVLLKEGNRWYTFPEDLDENAPLGMCYTSATTGNPKGVVYSHRGIYLHCYAIGLADSLALSESDVLMPVVPMFHVNAWGLPFAAAWFGSTQVLPGPRSNPQLLAQLIEDEKVTVTAGVPTIWLALLNELEQNNYNMKSLRSVVCGGAAAPKGVIKAFEMKHKIPFYHAYGMTETSPVVTVSRLKSYQWKLSEEEKLDIRAKQGIVVPGLEVKVVGENGEVPWNGEDMGELYIRGPWIANEYYQDDRTKQSFKDGWLHTGDLATIDEEGMIKLVDRTKDVIKSGGEWISSVDLESALMAHEAIFEAAVIAVPHPKWLERPLACVVLKDAFKNKVTKEDLSQYLMQHFVQWWIPDDIIFLEELPKTSVGKFMKRTLREKFKNHVI
jgi:fatty-acyl-CoA synthase